MPPQHDHLNQLLGHEQDFLKLRQLFEDADEGEQERFKRIEQMITVIRDHLRQTQQTEPADASDTGGSAGQENESGSDRRKEFRKARRGWQAVKEKAIQDLEAVKDGIRDYYLDDPEQFAIASGKLGRLDEIMDNLNDDLRDILDQYVGTPKNRQADRDRLGAEAASLVQRFLDYATSDSLLNAVDQKEFADVVVKAPIEKALKELVKTIE